MTYRRLLAIIGVILASLLPSTVESDTVIFTEAGASVWIEPSSQHVYVDDAAPVSVLVDNASGLFGIEFRLTFDPTRLQVRDANLEAEGVQISPGYFPDPAQGMVVANSADNIRGTIDYAVTLLAPAQPVNGSGTVASISFKATALGESQLHLQSVKLATNRGEPIPATSRDGQITIGSAFSSLTATSTPTPLPLATAASTRTATPSSTATATPSPPGATSSQTGTTVPPDSASAPPDAAPPPASSTSETAITPVLPGSTATGAQGTATPTPTIAPEATAQPPGFEVKSTWYFAEGSTKAPFDTWLLLQNPGGNEARVRVLFMADAGIVTEFRTTLGPTSRRSLLVNEVVPDQDVSMVVQADSVVLVERAVYSGRDGHDSAGIRAPARRWYLAEGSAQPPFQTWILIQNPGVSPAAVDIHYMGDDGSAWVQRLSVPPLSRASVFANLVLPPVAFSTRIDADQPVVVERSTYLESGGGNASPGIASTSPSWFMAEGSTEEGIDTWILLQNPGMQPVFADLTAMMPDGATERFHYLLPPASRTSIYANQILPPTQFGMKVEADGPIVVERAMYFGSPSRATHSSVASPAAATLWYLPEGSTAYPFHEYLLLLNPGNRPVGARVTFMKEDGFGLTKDFPMLPASRLTIDVNREVPDAAVSARVTSDGPIVVERSMYFSEGQGGTNTTGIPGG